MSDTAILQMSGVRKSFGTSVALDQVDFALGAREVHGLLGGNGAGKTTLMNILYGLYRMDAGNILFHGQSIEIRSPKDAIRQRIGMVHQHFLGHRKHRSRDSPEAPVQYGSEPGREQAA
jgi:ABC-type uncharacterized transport system ATPase subunit